MHRPIVYFKAAAYPWFKNLLSVRRRPSAAATAAVCINFSMSNFPKSLFVAA
jgi:hypothetical protein